MFKLESYIAPLLMGYIDKYVKLKQEDFQLSLWGGDAVLNKLDLRLDEIEHALNIPITFKSGFIHELRIHVPWTKLGSEPVIITINTIECILKLRDSAADDETASTKSASSVRSASQVVRPKPKKQDVGEDLPPGYLQSLVNRIVNNVNIVINNLILKFVEDDIVLSVNVKSAECYSVNSDWMRAFIELNVPDLVLRRVINFHDLTVCLDRRNASGKIEMYQDPLLYRCSLTCRMHMTYDSLHAKLPSVTKFNLLCEKLDLSLTETQVPMFFRLVELVVALYYGTLELPGAPLPTTTSDTDTHPEVPSAEFTDFGMSEEDMDGQGWATWAWSYVPQILPSGEEEELEDQPRKKNEPAVLTLGFYITRASVVFKLTELVQEYPYAGTPKCQFKPCMHWEAEGIGLDVLMHGIDFFNVQFGVTSSRIKNEGDAICGIKDVENSARDPSFFRIGMKGEENSPITCSYTSNSLFDPGGAENQGDQASFVFDGEKHMEIHTESFAMQKFGALWMDYVYTMDTQPERQGGSRSSGGSHVEESVRENSVIRFVIGPAHLLLSSSMYQRMSKFIHCVGDHEYEPYSKPHKEIVDETRKPPSEEEVRALEEFVPTRTYHVTLLKPTVWCQAADLPTCDVTKKKMAVRKKSRKSKSRLSETSPSPIPMLPVVVLQMERFDFQITSAMYPRQVVRSVSQMATPSDGLLHHCHSHMYIKVFGVQAGLTCVDANGSSASVQNIIQPWSGAYYRKLLLLPMYWKNPLQSHVTFMYELPHLTVNSTKPQVMMLAHIALSWQEKTPQPAKFLTLSIMEDVFHVSELRRSSKQPVLEVTLSGLEVRECRTPAVWSAMGTLTSLQAMVLHIGSGGDSITPVLYGPLKTSAIPHLDFFNQLGTSSQDNLHEGLMFTIQMPLDANIPVAPAAVLVDMKGMVGCLDPILFDWLTYTPEMKVKGEARDNRKTLGHHLAVDPVLVESTSPLKNRRPSQGSHSGSTATYPTDSPSATNTQTQSQSLRPTLTRTDVSADPTEQGSAAMKSWGQRMAALFPLVKIMEMQVDLQNCCVFFPSRHIQLQEPSMNIADNLKAVYLAGTLPDTLVACCPAVNVTSAGHKSLLALQDIPIKALEQSVAGEKLPWAVDLSHGSIYSIHSSKYLHYTLNPVSLSATVAVTTKYQPVTSDNISMLGLCIHVDMDAVTMASSKEQVQLVCHLGMGYMNVVKKLLSSVKNLQDMVSSSSSFENDPSLPHSMPARLIPRVASSSSQLEHQDMVVTVTETSETWSHDMSPHKDVDEANGVKLSLWIQWTLPKLVLRLQEAGTEENELCLCTELEDVTSSVDLQDVYSKVKMKIGSLSINHFHRRNLTEAWETGDHEGILMSCSEQLNRNVQIVSNKLWANPNQPSPSLFSSGELKPRDKSHSFLTMTFTRALRKNVKKRMRKVNTDPVGTTNESEKKDTDTPERGMIYLNELCVNVLPCDVVLNGPVLASVLDVMTLNYAPGSSSQVLLCDDLDLGENEVFSTKSESSKSASKSKNSLPLLTSSLLPLIYVNATNFRLFIPKCSPKTSDVEESLDQEDAREKETQTFQMPKDSSRKLGYKSADLQHDVCMLQISVISLTPQADNPLPRNVVDKEVYRRALHAGITHHPGSEVEDRQYQLDIAGLSLSTGCWSELAKSHSKRDSNQVTDGTPVQNPALEWNNLLADQSGQDDVKMIPIASSFDLRIVAAPAIVYHPSATDPIVREPVVVCGYSLEVNATTDIDFYLSTAQARLLLDIYDTNFTGLIAPTPKVNPNKEDINAVGPSFDHFPIQDSWGNMASIREDASLRCDMDSIAGNSFPSSVGIEFTPADILLTAGKISFMVYAHIIESPLKCATAVPGPRGLGPLGLGPGGLEVPGPVRHARSKGDLEWRTDLLGQDSTSDSGFGTLSKSTSSASVNAALQDGNESLIRLAPFLYAHFSQPHTLVTCHSSNQKVELSCYDIVLKGAKPGSVTLEEGKLIPDPIDFCVHWIETRPGQPNPKTGIPPSLYTLTITDFIHQTAVVKLKIARPLKLNASIGKIEQTICFLKEFTGGTMNKEEPLLTEPDMDPTKSQVPPMLKTLGKLDSLHLLTVQIVVCMETAPCAEAPTLQLSTSSLDGCTSFRLGSQDYVDEITQTLCINNFIAKTTYMGKSQPLIGPVTGNLTVNSQWSEHSGPSHLPSILCSMDCGSVQIFVGQEHILCLHLMGGHVLEYIKSQYPSESLDKEKQTPRKSSFKETKKTSPKGAGPTQQLQRSEDDLRAGAFEYIAEDPGSSHMMPGTHEILFNSDLDEGHATLTWCYPEPRSVTSLQVTPVPLTVTQPSYTNYIDENLKVPCVLQFWNVLTREWVDYGEFAISEHESCHLHLPEVMTSLYNPEVGVAQSWRVEILHPRDREEYAHYAYGPEDNVEPLVSALTLAASIRVDSCFSPILVPMMQCCISASVVQVRLTNHLQFLGKETPCKLQPFIVDCVSANNQEVALFTLDSPILTMSHLAGHHYRVDLGASATVALEVLEFRNLTLQPVLEPFDVDMEFSWQKGKEQPSLKVQVLVDPVEILVGASTVHTMHGTSQAWNQLMIRKPAERIVMQYYVICNNTLQNIRIGQAGTDECVQVVSRQAHPYSWRTHKARQELQLSVEGCGGVWTEPLDIDKEGTYVRMLENHGQRSTLIIKVTQLSGVQKQVVISGQVHVASRLTQHLEIKLLTESASVKDGIARDPLSRDTGVRDSAPVTLGAQQDAPSFVVEHSTVRALKVRLLGIKTVWSQEIPITGEKMKESRLIKVMFLPLFLVRTHLPCPLLMNIETLRLKSSLQLELQGQGHEQHLHMMGGDMTHNITFQLSRRMPASSPPISLSSGLIEQVPRQGLENIEVDGLLSQWQGDLASYWPYNHVDTPEKEPPRPVAPAAAPKQDIIVPHQPTSLVPPVDGVSDQPDIDLQITLSQRWPGCNTVLIDIAPHWLFVNETDLDLLVIESSNQQWRLPRHKTFAPPVFEGSFQLGLVHNGRITSSSVIILSDGDNLNRYLPEVEGVLYKYGHVNVDVNLSQIGSAKQQICYLILHSMKEENIRIVSIRERYRLVNNTLWDLDAHCFSLPLSEEKVTLDHKNASSRVLMGTKSEKADNNSPLPFWSRPVTTANDQSEFGDHGERDHVQYLCFRLCSNANAMQSSPAPSYARDLLWSVPCRVRSVEGGSRITMAIPSIDPEGLFQTEPCVLVSQLYKGMTYLVLATETNPTLELRNNCGFPLHYGQALSGVNIEGVTTQEEAELTKHLPILPPGGSAYYSFPSWNSTFPEIGAQTAYPKIHFASCEKEQSKTVWSTGVDVSANLDIFVNIPGESDTKVHIEKISHTFNIYVDPVSRAEISAKEIRSRIKGREMTVVVDTVKEKKNSPDKIKDTSLPKEIMRQESYSKEKLLKIKPPMKIDVAVLCKSVSLSVMDDCSSMAVISEVIRLTGDNICVFYCPSQPRDPFFVRPHVLHKVTLCVGDIQLDNQMHGRGNYDFPVVLVRQGPSDLLDLDVDFVKMSTGQKVMALQERSFLSVDGILCWDLVSGSVNLQNLDVCTKPISIFLEDTFLYDTVKRIVKFIPLGLSQGGSLEKSSDKKQAVKKQLVPKQVECNAIALSHPIRLDGLVIQPTRLLVSVHASLKLFIASDNAPLSFGRFERRGVMTTVQQLVRVIAMHYASGALFRAGLVVGSLEILGNPTGLVRSIGNGVSDLFRMPYEGLYRGPGAFVGGVTNGMTSLFKHVSTGTLNSITNFASSVSRNMDRLSLDSEHKERQDLSRRHKPTGLSEGFKQGLTGFGMSLLGAVAGIADQPLQSITQPSTTERPTSASQRATGIVSGVGKGLVGAVTKPIGGAAEFVSQTGMGLLQGVGLGNFPTPRHLPVLVTREARPNGNLKYMQKMLHTVPNVDMLVSLEGSWMDFRGQGQKVILLLTPEILFLVNQLEDTQQQAFAVTEIECCAGSRSPDQLHILMRDPDMKSQTWQDDQNRSKARVAEFIDGAASYIRPFKRESHSQESQSDASSHANAPIGSKRYEFQVEARSRQLFLAVFHTAKARATGAGFPL